MKIGNISSTNQKGQIVIPAAMREQLGITADVPLHISIKGNVIHIVPIKEIITDTSGGSSYLELLKKTQGSWKNSKETSPKRSLELEASKKRKDAW